MFSSEIGCIPEKGPWFDSVLAQGRSSRKLRWGDALGTYADEFKFMPNDLEIGAAFLIMSNRDLKINRGINHAITTNTSEMIMVFRFPVKPFQRAARFEFLNIAAFSKDFKVAIDGSKADAGQAFTNHCIDLIGTGMSIHFTKLLQDNSPLTRHPEI